MLRRRRFGDLIDRQLALVVDEESYLLDDVDTARAAWIAAPRDEAEECFGEYQLALEALKDRLTELRDTYAATLDEPEEYEREFEREVVRRWRDIEAV